MLRVGLVVGEPSGDALGAGLIGSLQTLHPDVRVEGILGPQLTALGGNQIFSMDRLSVMGIFEVLSHYVDLASIRNRLKHHFLRNPPDVFIGIDAPDFNLQLEADLRRAGIPTMHYVSPSVWAWRPGRVKTVASAADKLLTLFPFEKNYYRATGLEVECVGHPLADEIPLGPYQNDMRLELGLPADQQILAIMPGSRAAEFSRHAEVFLQTAYQCWENHSELYFVSSLVNDEMRVEFDRLVASQAPGLPIKTYSGLSREVLAACDVALLASGTITLEAMCLKKPMVVAYRISPLSYQIARRLVVSRWISLPNILAQEPLVPEFIQSDVRPATLVPALEHWLTDRNARSELQRRFESMHADMRLDTNQTAAKAVLSLCQKHH